MKPRQKKSVNKGYIPPRLKKFTWCSRLFIIVLELMNLVLYPLKLIFLRQMTGVWYQYLTPWWFVLISLEPPRLPCKYRLLFFYSTPNQRNVVLRWQASFVGMYNNANSFYFHLPQNRIRAVLCRVVFIEFNFPIKYFLCGISI